MSGSRHEAFDCSGPVGSVNSTGVVECGQRHAEPVWVSHRQRLCRLFGAVGLAVGGLRFLFLDAKYTRLRADEASAFCMLARTADNAAS